MMAPGGHPRRIPAGPKITELPAATKAANSAPAQPAMFILTNGERIETRQYLVTYDHVELTVDRQSRILPLSTLDVNATLDADRKRGIDLRIPPDTTKFPWASNFSGLLKKNPQSQSLRVFLNFQRGYGAKVLMRPVPFGLPIQSPGRSPSPLSTCRCCRW